MTTANARRAASLAAAMLSLATLAACGSPAPSEGEAGGNGGTSSSTPMERPMAKEGEMCGGIAGIQCDDGLFCQLEGAYPDASGTCSNLE